jgi:hypothetical protein
MNRYQNLAKAAKAGWGRPRLDHCFNNPGVGGMGYHYINTEILDTTVDELQPEALVYAPHENGRLELAAVEFIVPAAPWDPKGTVPTPSTGRYSPEQRPVYVLHAWLFKENPVACSRLNPLVSARRTHSEPLSRGGDLDATFMDTYDKRTG